MATPIVLKTGVTGVVFNLKGIDNSVVVDINADGGLGNGGLGWFRVLEMNTSFNPAQNVSIDLSGMLATYKGKGATSVTLTVVANNWSHSGSINAGISFPGGSQAIAQPSITPYTSVQFAYTLVL
jgi:hypothetical protein